MLVQLGIDAPREIKVYREEVFHRIQAEEMGAVEDKAASVNKTAKSNQKKEYNESGEPGERKRIPEISS